MDKKEQEFLDAYNKYADDIYRHCFFRVYNKELAEDLTQETFIKTWKYISEGKEIKNIRAFLYKVAVNLVIDWSRQKKVLPLDERLYSMDSKIINFIEVNRIIEAIKRLDEPAREIMIMRYVDGLNPAEIAEILKKTPNAISISINRATEKLKEVINKKNARTTA